MAVNFLNYYLMACKNWKHSLTSVDAINRLSMTTMILVYQLITIHLLPLEYDQD